MARLPKEGEQNWGGVLNDYLLTAHNPDGTLRQDAVAAAKTSPQSSDQTATQVTTDGLPLFNVEAYGAVGDGKTDDYKAIQSAWNAMLASPSGGFLFFPRPVVYRVDATVLGRLTSDSDGAYALFKLPFVSSSDPKLTFGVKGVGSPFAPRDGSNRGAANTSSVLFADYSNAFGWNDSKGLPSVFGALDVDKAPAHNGASSTNVHFVADGLTIRQPKNPSMCGMNLEGCATAHLGSVAFDVTEKAEDAPEPTHPTGAALLLPASGNQATVKVETFLAVGHYAGLPYAEHANIGSAVVLRCKIAVSFRRKSDHFGHLSSVTVVQCPWGFAGYDPSGPGVAAMPDSCTVKVDFCDFTDTTQGGKASWTYAPTVGAHLYDPGNTLEGLVWASRTDEQDGHTDTLAVNGATHFSTFGLFGFSIAGSQRVDVSSHVPSN